MVPRALVTGVCGSIGRAIARVLDEDGWWVAGTDHPSIGELPDLDAYASCDLADSGDVAQTVASLSGDRLNLLVACAAVQPTGGVLSTSAEEWAHTFDVNVGSVMIAIHAAHPALRATEGSVAIIGSVHSMATSGGRTAYVASKGAVDAMARSAALELAKDRIRVNVVAPGAIDTPMLREGLTARGSSASELAARTPLGRLGTPQDVAHAVRFLAGPQASFITGQSLVVDGGAVARLSTE